jgi:Xaa-Pro aminopeptidase
MDPAEIAKYRKAQDLARETMECLVDHIRHGMTEAEIAHDANEFMRQRGASFWYHGKGALVFVGERTTLSVSGKDYIASDEQVKPHDFITVDLSPSIDGYWGDYARSLVVEQGKVVNSIVRHPNLAEIMSGSGTARMLHDFLRIIADQETTLDTISKIYRRVISNAGYVNLDFRGNLGHSIETQLDQRRFIEPGSDIRLGELGFFTFEPHIRNLGGRFGFKREDIYYFQDECLRVL